MAANNVVSMNKHKSYIQLAQIQSNCILDLQKEQSFLKALIVAAFLIIITMGAGFTLALNKISKEPTTVYLQGYDSTVDINDLPLAPLEELK